MKLNVIPRSNIWLALSTILVVASLILVTVFGLRQSIEFTGGSILEIQVADSELGVTDVRASLEATGIDSRVQSSDDGVYLIRMPDLLVEEKNALSDQLSSDLGTVEELRYESIGPVLGSELKRKSVIALILLALAIVGYVAWTFRQVSKPVSSWKYGVITIVAALHDIVIPIGVFAVLGQLFGYQVDIAFVAAILTILGYSINDTIVVFDRTRENLLRKRYVDEDEFADIVNDSVNQSATRSINTSVTTLLALLAVFFFGGETLRPFVLALMIGILSGAYSSLFLASPLLVKWQTKDKS